MKTLFPITVAMFTALALPLGAAAQTSFGKDQEIAAPTNQDEWADQLHDNLMNSIAASRSSLALHGTLGTDSELAVTVARDGRVTDIKLVESTGRPAMDQGLLRAASRTKQVAPFTPDMKGDAVTMNLGLKVSRN